jgi:hypothetical protein
LILRFFALYFTADNYSRPLKAFLNRFMGSNRFFQHYSKDILSKAFIPTIELIDNVFSSDAFRPERALNAAVYDSVMVGLARRIERGGIENPDSVRTAYEKLLTDNDYTSSTKGPTADETMVRTRLNKATAAFFEVI